MNKPPEPDWVPLDENRWDSFLVFNTASTGMSRRRTRCICHDSGGSYPPFPVYTDPEQVRRVAAWLLECAAYMEWEQQQEASDE